MEASDGIVSPGGRAVNAAGGVCDQVEVSVVVFQTNVVTAGAGGYGEVGRGNGDPALAARSSKVAGERPDLGVDVKAQQRIGHSADCGELPIALRSVPEFELHERAPRGFAGHQQ